MTGPEIGEGTIHNMNTSMNEEIAIATESVMNQIFTIRGQRVMLDDHLAQLYKGENRVLKSSVKKTTTVSGRFHVSTFKRRMV